MRTPKWFTTAGNQFNSWGSPQVPYSDPGLCRTIWVSKNAEFYADSKSVEMGEINVSFQSYGQKTMLNLAKLEFSGFSAFFVCFLPITLPISTHLKSA